MNHRFLTSTVALVVVILVAVPASGQKTWTPPRTADGKPDIEGIWTNATVTPLERPGEFAGEQFLTEKGAAEFEKKAVYDAKRDRRDGAADAHVLRAYNGLRRGQMKAPSGKRHTMIVRLADG